MVFSLATVGRAGALFAALGVVVPSARAQVTFSAPRACGTEQEFLTQVRALQRAGAESIRVTSVVIRERALGDYELRLEGPEGGRVLTDADCRILFRSAVVIAAAAGGDPAEGAAPQPPPPPPGSTAEPAAEASVPTSEPAPAAEPPQSPVPPPARPAPVAVALQPAAPALPPEPVDEANYLRIAAGGGAATGLSPEVALLLELGAAFGSEKWGGAVRLKYLPSSSATTEGELGLDLESIGGRSGVFYAPFPFLRVEAGLAVYRLTARGTGISHPTTDSVWMAAPELELMAVARLNTAWSLELGPHGRVGLTQPTFQVEPQTEVFQVPRFGAALVFRVQWGWR